MRHLICWMICIFFITLSSTPIFGSDPAGEVKIPVATYDDLIAASKAPKPDLKKPPAGFAIGQTDITVTVESTGNRTFADVDLRLNISVMEDQWVSIPVLPASTPIYHAKIDGRNVELIETAKGLVWGVNKAGAYKMHLKYQVDAFGSKDGYSITIPLPQSSANRFLAKIPGNVDPAVMPSAALVTKVDQNITEVRATVPSTNMVQMAWRIPVKDEPMISRAKYQGEVIDQTSSAISWIGEFEVELINDAQTKIRLIPQGVTLKNIKVDQKPGPIMIDKDQFATMAQGRGNHIIQVEFEVPVTRKQGPPVTDLSILPVPVSQLVLKIPGKKDVVLTPAASVKTQFTDKFTQAEAFVPMTSKVSISWTEALPEAIKTEFRANANIYHALYAQEGVLFSHALIDFDITRGETNVIELLVPKNIQINRITSAGELIADWQPAPQKNDQLDHVSVFLERKVNTPFQLNVYYDRSLTGIKTGENIDIPLLSVLNVGRQRGMVALLSSKEYTLKPVKEKQMTRVGENQLPAFVRNVIDKTIAHTYKYVEKEPELTVTVSEPERKIGKFDAKIDTLISLGDVTMTGMASIEINVKQGTIEDLTLDMPGNINFLGLTAPSMRDYKIVPGADRQSVNVFFTQEMEGQFRLEARYELIMADKANDVTVPTLAVKGAQVEQGKIAVEALTVVEVRPSLVEKLTSIDPGDLPKQLFLKTTNPILLAYKYNHVDPPYKLGLSITRHKEIDVKSAAIDKANYHTLFTKDGTAITTAGFWVRNSRKQFLRVKLPKGSKVWSVFVDGKSEKPAVSGEASKKDADGENILIKIKNLAQGFPVSLTYQTPVERFKSRGTVKAFLPNPDMVVTSSVWDVYLPFGVEYGKVKSNMTVLRTGIPISAKELSSHMASGKTTAQSEAGLQPLRFNVPENGIHYTLEKIYANQSEEDAFFNLPYKSGTGWFLPLLAGMLSCLCWWFGIGWMIYQPKKQRWFVGIVLTMAGTIGLIFAITYLESSLIPMAVISALALITIWLKLRTAKNLDNANQA